MEIAGKKVVDAKRPATIHITPKDVATGANKLPSQCAAAKAAVHSIPECISARVHIGRVYIEQKDRWVRYYTPESLRTEIIAFDKGGSFQPGPYTLRPPSPSTTITARSEYRSHANETRSERAKSKQHPRKLRVRVAKTKRHEVSGIRPKGAAR